MISIVIPSYNEEKGIKRTLTEVKKVMSDSGIDHEIIVVDDGSTDKTAEIVKNEKMIRLIQHPYNKGYGSALKTGTKNAKGDWVIYIDADVQHDPEDILKLIEHTKDYDMVVGARTKKSKISLLRRLGKIFLGSIANYLSGMKIPDLNSGFRAIRRDIVMEFMRILPDSFSFTTTITLTCVKSGYSIKYIPIETTEGVGTSKIRPFRDGFNFILMILRTITLFDPLKVFLPISIILFIIGSLYGLYYGIYEFNIPDGAILLIISSILIFFFGLLADQISSLRREIR